MITVIGSLNMDLVLNTTHFPQIGETITSTQYCEIPGGKGANQAVTIGKLQGHVEMIGAVGTDALGEKLLQNLTENGVGISGIKSCSNITTGTAFINVDNHGDNKIILVPGANHLVTSLDIDTHASLIEQSDFVILQLEIPLDTVAYAIKKAHSLGKKTVLNPAPACKLNASILQHIDILTPNETELELLTDIKINSFEDIKAASHKLIALGVKTVIVTIGDKGALIITNEHFFHIPGHKVNAIDTTAAGDSFTGALTLALSQGKSIEDAATFANKVASITVQRKGAQVSLPCLSELQLI